MAIKGGCLCGKVGYEITGSLLEADHCHCSMCRRQHGAAFSTYARFNPGEFRWVSGENFVKIYEVPSGGGWCFCSECGATLAGTDKGTITTVTLGTVEGDPGIRPGSLFSSAPRPNGMIYRMISRNLQNGLPKPGSQQAKPHIERMQPSGNPCR